VSERLTKKKKISQTATHMFSMSLCPKNQHRSQNVASLLHCSCGSFCSLNMKTL